MDGQREFGFPSSTTGPLEQLTLPIAVGSSAAFFRPVPGLEGNGIRFLKLIRRR